MFLRAFLGSRQTLSRLTLRKVPHHVSSFSRPYLEAFLSSRPPLVVALCASAGGVSALQQFFQALPERCHALSYVVLQQVSPGHETVLVEILQRSTSMTVSLGRHGQKVTGRSVVICPPGQYTEIRAGELLLRAIGDEPYLPADRFLYCLAEEQGERAVAVILSGTGSDGSKGLLVIKEAGGLVMVQDETGAEYTGMPHAAIETGAADFVLAPGDMAVELAHYLEHLADYQGLKSVSSLTIGELVETLRQQGGIDFSGYRMDMLMRRVRRRMAVRQMSQLEDYRRLLSGDRQEASSLTRDILIGVTRFFRDPEAFRELDHQFVKPLLEDRPGEALRLWVAGCSTGEEVYSLVILFRERAARLGQDLNLKVFATDLDEESLQIASLGRYRDNIAASVPGELLSKYFVPYGAGYQVTREIRECVYFSRHNLAKDPPFTNLDLISCRNLLIYFESELKRRVLSFLHFGLSPRGCLFLGASESPIELHECFLTRHQTFRIYQKSGLSSGLYRWPVHASLSSSPSGQDPVEELSRALDEGYRRLLQSHCPSSLLVDTSGQVLHVFVNADKYLRFPAGAVQLGLTDLLSPKLAAVASAALSSAFREEEPQADYPEIFVPQQEAEPPLGLRVQPVFGRRGRRHFALVTFRTVKDQQPAHRLVVSPEMDAQAQRHILELSQELQQIRTTFQVTVEELESTNEELQATNEEFQSTSQEYQATAEELRRELRMASQESLEMVDGNLVTLEGLKQEVGTYQAYLEHSHPAVLFLDSQLRILRATSGVHAFLPVLDQDRGRPVEHLAAPFAQSDFLCKARQVAAEGKTFDDLWPFGPAGQTVRMGLRPFREGGVVITFSAAPLLCEDFLLAIQQPAALVNRDGKELARNPGWLEISASDQVAIHEYLKGWPDLLKVEPVHRLAGRQGQLCTRPVLEGTPVFLAIWQADA